MDVEVSRAFILFKGEPVCLAAQTDDGKQVSSLLVKVSRFCGALAAGIADLSLTHGTLNETHFSSGATEFGDERLQIVFTVATGGTPPRGAVKFTPPKKKP